ncbi:NAD(P)-dependent dehydrogenase (short-subunit alcohol dehydrogenase family) [Solirubrobacter pauli]|uniref:NAD(P)-dependent dehydrogenase (Short-subunit alcohol dehydrogenase family) n=1 Tax=Solirubrobacter pauli TaxID=166793 RepID=A0A660KYT8_9ACTN|nr:SDR family oxidoreductase [Solirubrobacter pauli]RKQ86881.1 NAD(P)-dependent dehydrogenase (short-subunit alcohol dehydrogenase family) [Solirubrobacter pauli]
MTSLTGKTVLVIGRGSGIARAIAEAARAQGAAVIAAGRQPDALASAYRDAPDVRIEAVDLTDDVSITALAERVGTVDHVVSTASARARGRLGDLTRDAVQRSFDTKVIGPLLLAQAFQGRIAAGGSMLLFSGAAAFKIQVGTLAVAITNGAADTLTRSLAVELAPVRVNAISPGVIDTGAWDALGEQGKAELFAHVREHSPARRVGAAEDVAAAAILALTNPFLTGVTLHVDGGERLA